MPIKVNPVDFQDNLDFGELFQGPDFTQCLTWDATNNYCWDNNPFMWDDVCIVLELAGGIIENVVDDGTNTYITISVDLRVTAPVILDQNYNDSVTITISDDLTGLLLFNMFSRGWEETV
jgi:hypothetical protein